MDSTVSDVIKAAARYLDRQPNSRDVFLENVIVRIKQLHEQDCLPAAAIARRLLDTYARPSPYVQPAFIEFVISQL